MFHHNRKREYISGFAGPTSVAGADALAQIIEASRRGSDSLPSLNYGMHKPFGGVAGFEAAAAQTYRQPEPWSPVGLRDNFPVHPMDGNEQAAFSHAFMSGHNTVRYPGH